MVEGFETAAVLFYSVSGQGEVLRHFGKAFLETVSRLDYLNASGSDLAMRSTGTDVKFVVNNWSTRICKSPSTVPRKYRIF